MLSNTARAKRLRIKNSVHPKELTFYGRLARTPILTINKRQQKGYCSISTPQLWKILSSPRISNELYSRDSLSNLSNWRKRSWKRGSPLFVFKTKPRKPNCFSMSVCSRHIQQLKWRKVNNCGSPCLSSRLDIIFESTP